MRHKSAVRLYHVLQRMSIDGDDPNGSSPLMVLFVEMLVEAGMVEQPEVVKEQHETFLIVSAE